MANRDQRERNSIPKWLKNQLKTHKTINQQSIWNECRKIWRKNLHGKYNKNKYRKTKAQFSHEKSMFRRSTDGEQNTERVLQHDRQINFNNQYEMIIEITSKIKKGTKRHQQDTEKVSNGHQQGTKRHQRGTEGHQKVSKTVLKRAHDAQNEAYCQKYEYLIDLGSVFGAFSGPFWIRFRSKINFKLYQQLIQKWTPEKWPGMKFWRWKNYRNICRWSRICRTKNEKCFDPKPIQMASTIRIKVIQKTAAEKSDKHWYQKHDEKINNKIDQKMIRLRFAENELERPPPPPGEDNGNPSNMLPKTHPEMDAEKIPQKTEKAPKSHQQDTEKAPKKGTKTYQKGGQRQQKGTQRDLKGTKKGTKMMPKRCSNEPRMPKMEPAAKSMDLWLILDPF